MQSESTSSPHRVDRARRRLRRPLVSRLLGMETEYATMVLNRPELATGDLPSSAKVYAQICAAIRRDQPTAKGVFDRDQMFLASGGAVTFESHPTLHALPGGLVEIATPEVSSPDELLACQRSIDELVAKAAEEATAGVDLRVLKNSSDALGHVYGCQENYEAEVASGPWLGIYRLFVTLLWGMQVVSLLFALPILALTYLAIFVVTLRRPDLAPPTEAQSPSELFERLPGWLKTTLMGLLRVVHFPTVVVLRIVIKHIAFRKQRKYLTALLVTRVSLCGSGDLDHRGRYRLSAKAMATDRLADLGGYNGERPIFVYGHWLAQFCARSFLSLASTRSMYARRQRFQIGLSDSNLSELAEYVKLGSVSLILDMIEAGHTSEFVSLPKPLRSLHDIASDWNLVRHVPTNRGKMSALEIQQRYLNAAVDFVSGVPEEQRGEADLVLRRWAELLQVVRAFRREARNTSPALGRVDWLSKRWMIEQLGPDAEWVTRKKTDLRYHELSPEGYYYKLAASNPTLSLIAADRIEQRRRLPPADSPATKRGLVIREFAEGDEALAAEWRYAVLGEGKDQRRIDFE